MASKPDPRLSVVGTGPTGDSVTWWANSPRPGDRPQGLNFRTERGSGFVDGGCTLARDIRREDVDVASLNEFSFIGADGTIAFEGSLVTSPRSLDTSGHSISPTFVGPISLAQDRTMSEVYIDRRFSSWGAMPINEQAFLSLAGRDLQSLNWQTGQGDGIVANLPNQALGAETQTEMWYLAPDGTTIAKVQYVGSKTSYPAGWQAPALSSNATDTASGSSNVALTLDGTLRTATPATPAPYLWVQVYSAGTASTPVAGANVTFTQLAAIGNHGLTLRDNGSDPDALWLTDILIDAFNRYAPQIDTSQVRQNETLISHLVVENEYPHDVALDLNKYALWELGVWEHKRLQFEPADLTDYMWEVRLSDPGVTTSLQGDDAKNLRNGIVVQYTEAGTGKVRTLSPDDYDELRDDSVENPANQWGRTKWGDPLVLSQPCDEAMAVAAGEQRLAEDNAPKEAGDITITGHVRDRAGHWQPYWKPRAGDTVAITDDFPNARPRRIAQTSPNGDGYTSTISVDNSLNEAEAFLDRYGALLQAANLA